MTRPERREYFLGIEEAVAARSTCMRRQYGAVIVKNGVIVSTGYNGSPRQATNCCDAGECWRTAHNIPHGERYEMCQAVHAEANAIINANRADAKPCALCEKLIRNAQIRRVES